MLAKCIPKTSLQPSGKIFIKCFTQVCNNGKPVPALNLHPRDYKLLFIVQLALLTLLLG